MHAPIFGTFQYSIKQVQSGDNHKLPAGLVLVVVKVGDDIGQNTCTVQRLLGHFGPFVTFDESKNGVSCRP